MIKPVCTNQYADPPDRKSSNFTRISWSLLFALGIYSAIISVGANVLLQILPSREDFTPEQVTLLYNAMFRHSLAAVAALGITLILRRHRLRSPVLPRFLLAMTPLYALVSADQIAGIVFPVPDPHQGVLQPHVTRGWSHYPRAVGLHPDRLVRINSLGLCDRELPLRKPAGEYRVLFVGDSVTRGLGLALEENFVTRLEPLLNNPPRKLKIRTINAGCDGYTTWQQTDYLKRDGLQLSPDFVVLGFCINDVLDVVDAPPGLVRGRPWITDYPRFNHVSGIVRMVAHYSNARRAKIFREQHLWTNQNRYAEQNNLVFAEEALADPPPPRLAAAWDRILEDLSDFAKVCAGSAVPWMLVAFPIEPMVSADPPGYSIYSRLEQWATRNDVPWLDMTPVFRRWTTQHNANAGLLFNDTVHLSPLGARVTAEELHRFLSDENQLLPAPSHAANE